MKFLRTVDASLEWKVKGTYMVILNKSYLNPGKNIASASNSLRVNSFTSAGEQTADVSGSSINAHSAY